MMTKHSILHRGFHGEREIIFRGQAAGFELSKSQARKWESAICPFRDQCHCDGRDGAKHTENSARIEYDEISECYTLVPARAKNQV